MSITKEAKAAYDREYRAKHRARIAEAKRAWALANPEWVLAQSLAWAKANREKSRGIKNAWKLRNPYVPHPKALVPKADQKASAIQRSALWRLNNPEMYAIQLAKAALIPSKPRTSEQKARHASAQSLRCRKLQRAQPVWANLKDIEAIYIEGQRTGMHVDHIIPLQGKTVSGLHVAGNLQLLTPLANYRKRNKFIQESDHAD